MARWYETSVITQPKTQSVKQPVPLEFWEVENPYAPAVSPSEQARVTGTTGPVFPEPPEEPPRTPPPEEPPIEVIPPPITPLPEEEPISLAPIVQPQAEALAQPEPLRAEEEVEEFAEPRTERDIRKALEQIEPELIGQWPPSPEVWATLPRELREELLPLFTYRMPRATPRPTVPPAMTSQEAWGFVINSITRTDKLISEGLTGLMIVGMWAGSPDFRDKVKVAEAIRSIPKDASPEEALQALADYGWEHSDPIVREVVAPFLNPLDSLGRLGGAFGRFAEALGKVPTPSPFAPSEAMTFGELGGQLTEQILEPYHKKVVQPLGGALAAAGLGPMLPGQKEDVQRRVQEKLGQGMNLWEALGAVQEERPELLAGEKFIEEFLGDPANLIGLGWEPNVARALARSAKTIVTPRVMPMMEATVKRLAPAVQRLGGVVDNVVSALDALIGDPHLPVSVRTVLADELGNIRFPNGRNYEDLSPSMQTAVEDILSGRAYQDKLGKWRIRGETGQPGGLASWSRAIKPGDGDVLKTVQEIAQKRPQMQFHVERTLSEVEAMSPADLLTEVRQLPKSIALPKGVSSVGKLPSLSTEALPHTLLPDNVLWDADIRVVKPYVVKTVGDLVSEMQYGTTSLEPIVNNLRRQGYDAIYIPESVNNPGIVIPIAGQKVGLTNPRVLTRQFIGEERNRLDVMKALSEEIKQFMREERGGMKLPGEKPTFNLGKSWDASPVPARAALAQNKGLPGTVGSKAWADLTPEERATLEAVTPPTVGPVRKAEIARGQGALPGAEVQPGDWVQGLRGKKVQLKGLVSRQDPDSGEVYKVWETTTGDPYQYPFVKTTPPTQAERLAEAEASAQRIIAQGTERGFGQAVGAQLPPGGAGTPPITPPTPILPDVPAPRNYNILGMRPVQEGLTQIERVANQFKGIVNRAKMNIALADEVATPTMAERARIGQTLESQVGVVPQQMKARLAQDFSMDKEFRITRLANEAFPEGPTIQDLVAHEPEFWMNLTTAQQETLRWLRYISEEYAGMWRAHQISAGRILGRRPKQLHTRTDIAPPTPDHPEGGFYLPRGIATPEGYDEPVKIMAVRGRMGGGAGFRKPATLDSMAWGIQNGYEYNAPWEAMASYMRKAGQESIDRYTANFFLALKDSQGIRIAQTAADRVRPKVRNSVERLATKVGLERIAVVRAKVAARAATQGGKTAAQWAEQSERLAANAEKRLLDSLSTERTDEVIGAMERELFILRREALKDATRAKALGAKGKARQEALVEKLAEYDSYQNQLRDLRGQYNRAKEIASSTPRGRGVIGMVELQGYDFPDALANASNVILNEEVRNVGLLDRSVQVLNGMYRTSTGTMDNSAVLVQGLLAAYNDRTAVGQALKTNIRAITDETAYGAFAKAFDDRAIAIAKEYGLEETPDLLWWSRQMLHQGGPGAELRPGAALPETLQRRVRALPGFQQADRMYQTYTDTTRAQWAQDELVKELRGANLLGIQTRAPGSLKELVAKGTTQRIAESINRMTGWSSGQYAGGIADLVLYAPRNFQSRMETIVNGIAGLRLGAPVEQRLARTALFNMLWKGTALTVAANVALGNETDVRPMVPDGHGGLKRNMNFMRIRFAGRDWSLFGQYDSILGVVLETASGDPTRATRSLMSGFIANATWDIIAGSTMVGKRVRDTRDQMLGYIAESFQPFSLGESLQAAIGTGQAALAGDLPKTFAGALTTVGVAFGGKSSPLSYSDIRKQVIDEYVKEGKLLEMYPEGVDYPDLSQADKRLVNADERIKAKEAEFQTAPLEDAVLVDKLYRDLDIKYESLEKESLIREMVEMGITGPRLHDAISQLKRDRWTASSTLFNEENRAAIARLRTKGVPRERDILAQRYLDVPLEIDPLTLEPDFNKRDKERAAILREADAAGVLRIYLTGHGLESYRGERFKDPVIRKAVEQDEANTELLRKYWDIADKLDAQEPDFKAVGDRALYLQARYGNAFRDYFTEEEKRTYQNRAQSIKQNRLILRNESSLIDQALRRVYGYTEAETVPTTTPTPEPNIPLPPRGKRDPSEEYLKDIFVQKALKEWGIKERLYLNQLTEAQRQLINERYERADNLIKTKMGRSLTQAIGLLIEKEIEYQTLLDLLDEELGSFPKAPISAPTPVMLPPGTPTPTGATGRAMRSPFPLPPQEPGIGGPETPPEVPGIPDDVLEAIVWARIPPDRLLALGLPEALEGEIEDGEIEIPTIRPEDLPPIADIYSRGRFIMRMRPEFRGESTFGGTGYEISPDLAEWWGKESVPGLSKPSLSTGYSIPPNQPFAGIRGGTAMAPRVGQPGAPDIRNALTNYLETAGVPPEIAEQYQQRALNVVPEEGLYFSHAIVQPTFLANLLYALFPKLRAKGHLTLGGLLQQNWGESTLLKIGQHEAVHAYDYMERISSSKAFRKAVEVAKQDFPEQSAYLQTVPTDDPSYYAHVYTAAFDQGIQDLPPPLRPFYRTKAGLDLLKTNPMERTRVR